MANDLTFILGEVATMMNDIYNDGALEAQASNDDNGAGKWWYFKFLLATFNLGQIMSDSLYLRRCFIETCTPARTIQY
jgi:hypothetical protein